LVKYVSRTDPMGHLPDILRRALQEFIKYLLLLIR
jgi:hypothetical protein